MKNEDEKCYYCLAKGAYWEYKESEIISVCKKHLQLESSG